MSEKIAIKKLTQSDLTLFEWHFRNRNAGNQKAINLNRSVFIDQLYPSLPAIANSQDGKLPLDLTIFGPGVQSAINLQRKIIKFGTYKNWRLDGEFIHNPSETPDRFNSLQAGDFAVFEFQGDIQPRSATMVLVARDLDDDQELHEALMPVVANSPMVAVTGNELQEAISNTGLSAQHPILSLLLQDAIEDAAFGGIAGTKTLLSRRRTGRSVSQSELDNARQTAGIVGREGEEIINDYLTGLCEQSRLQSFEWISQSNAISPFDFRCCEVGGAEFLVDVKSTRGAFKNPIHISLAELGEMRDSEFRYDLYRVYRITSAQAVLRISRDLRNFASEVLASLGALPPGVAIDGISVQPDAIPFENEIELTLGNEFGDDQ